MSKKVSLAESKQLIKALFPTLSRNAGANLPQSRAALDGYTRSPTEKPLYDAITDFKNEPKLPLTAAFEHMPSKTGVQSNVLLFRNRNQLLHRTDFAKLVDPTTSLFALPDSYDFRVVQSRTPLLQFAGGYYLVFKTPEEAAAYLVDTMGRKLNGVDLYLEMVDPVKHQSYMTSSVLQEELKKLGDDVWGLEANYDREEFVVVTGIPVFVKQGTMEDMLWEYDIDYEHSSPIQCLMSDNISKVSVWLIKFSDKVNARRFVRKYNNRPFNNDNKFARIYTHVLA